MYIKVKGFHGMYNGSWMHYIYSDKGKVVCFSEKTWYTQGGAVRAAIKLATTLGIEYRGTK